MVAGQRKLADVQWEKSTEQNLSAPLTVAS
jgi:hypothetical protein